MADMKGILKKVGGMFNAKRGEARKGMTSNEMELAFFKERERLDNVKKELKPYRDKENQSVLLGDDSLLKSEYGFNEKKNIFGGENTLNKKHKDIPSLLESRMPKKENIMGVKNVFFKG